MVGFSKSSSGSRSFRTIKTEGFPFEKKNGEENTNEDAARNEVYEIGLYGMKTCCMDFLSTMSENHYRILHLGLEL